ncbi:hypothetical protein BH23ACT9_BH23ACT9_20400 [soil metagenome]
MTAIPDLVSGPVVEPRLDAARTEVARLVNAARATLLSSGTAISVDQLADGKGTGLPAARKWLSRRRLAGELVTVTHEGAVLIPTFQLDDAFVVDPAATHVVSRLLAYGMSGWAVWDWAQTANGWLDGETPADLLRSGRTSEVAAAVEGLTSAA